ncbi:MAG TPA: hypothetical protein ENN19_02675 [Chloroflexi bacterium]|nr:hypothetical protein [Chloroflexota bacterium]
MKGQIEDLLERGIEAAQAGEDERARDLLIHVIELDERNEDAWLWLSFVIERTADRIVCLENILTINPNDEDAAEELDRLLRERSIEVGTPTLPRLEKSEIGASAVCSQCGYRNPTWVYLCDRCGADLRPVDVRVALSSGVRPRTGSIFSLLGAWSGMLLFNPLLAFMPELALASWARSLAALLLAALFITLWRLGLTVASSEFDVARSFFEGVGPSALSALIAALLVLGWTALISLPLALVTWVTARLVGGQRDFKTHAHLVVVMLSGWTVIMALLASFILLILHWLGFEDRLLIGVFFIRYDGDVLAIPVILMSLAGVIWLKQAVQTAHHLSGIRAALTTVLALALGLGGLLAYAALFESDLSLRWSLSHHQPHLFYGWRMLHLM